MQVVEQPEKTGLESLVGKGLTVPFQRTSSLLSGLSYRPFWLQTAQLSFSVTHTPLLTLSKARDSSFSMPEILEKFQWDHPQLGCQIEMQCGRYHWLLAAGVSQNSSNQHLMALYLEDDVGEQALSETFTSHYL